MCLFNCNCFKSTSKFPNTVTVCFRLSSESLFIDVLGKLTITDLFSQYKMLRYAEMHVYLYKKCTFARSSSTTETRAIFSGHVKFFVDDVDGINQNCTTFTGKWFSEKRFLVFRFAMTSHLCNNYLF